MTRLVSDQPTDSLVSPSPLFPVILPELCFASPSYPLLVIPYKPDVSRGCELEMPMFSHSMLWPLWMWVCHAAARPLLSQHQL